MVPPPRGLQPLLQCAIDERASVRLRDADKHVDMRVDQTWQGRFPGAIDRDGGACRRRRRDAEDPTVCDGDGHPVNDARTREHTHVRDHELGRRLSGCDAQETQHEDHEQHESATVCHGHSYTLAAPRSCDLVQVRRHFCGCRMNFQSPETCRSTMNAAGLLSGSKSKERPSVPANDVSECGMSRTLSPTSPFT